MSSMSFAAFTTCNGTSRPGQAGSLAQVLLTPAFCSRKPPLSWESYPPGASPGSTLPPVCEILLLSSPSSIQYHPSCVFPRENITPLEISSTTSDLYQHVIRSVLPAADVTDSPWGPAGQSSVWAGSVTSVSLCPEWAW